MLTFTLPISPLKSALIQFFQIFPEYQSNEFYATGEVWFFGFFFFCYIQTLFHIYTYIILSKSIKLFSIPMQSYAGKYVPAISYYIHKNNPTAKVKINLIGMAIGDGLCDPELVCI